MTPKGANPEQQVVRLKPKRGQQDATDAAHWAAYNVCQELSAKSLQPLRVEVGDCRSVIVIHRHGRARIVTVCLEDGRTITVD